MAQKQRAIIFSGTDSRNGIKFHKFPMSYLQPPRNDVGAPTNFMPPTNISQDLNTENGLWIKTAAIEQSISAMALIDLDGRITYANPACLKLWGYGKESEVVGSHIVKFFKAMEEAAPLVDSIRSTGKWEGEFEAKRKNGTTFISHLLTNIVTDKLKNPLCFTAMFLDMTEHRLAENTLREEKEKFRAVIESAQDAIYIKDRFGRYIIMNPAGARLFGLRPQDIPGKTDLDLFGVKTGRDIQKIDKELMAKKISCTYEKPRRYNGDEHYFHTTKVPYCSSNGEVIGLIGISRDMTEQRKAARMVEFYREYAENIVLHLPLSLLVINRALCINFANQHFLSKMRMGREDVIGKSVDKLFSVALIRTAALDKKILEVIKGESDIVKDRLTSRGRSYDYMITPLREQSGKRRNALLVMEDITESVAMEDHLLHSEKLAAVGKFTAAVAHEINNPLSVVVGNIQYLLSNIHEVNLCNKKEVKNLEEMLKTANFEARRCADIVRNLLHFSHKGEAKHAEMNINDTVERTLQMLAPQIKVSRMKIRTDLADRLPPIMGNTDRLQQVFVNLVLNAQQAMKEDGRLTIKTALVGNHVTVTFKDTGPGIPKKYLRRIFEPFYSTKEAGKGTGLGLFIVHSIMQDHHGEISVQSKRGNGAAFILKFPAVKKRGWFGF